MSSINFKTGFLSLICLTTVISYSCKKSHIDNPNSEIQESKVIDIYVAGFSDKKIVYWKNGVENILASSNRGTGDALGIAVSGSDVFVVGKNNNQAVFWKMAFRPL